MKKLLIASLLPLIMIACHVSYGFQGTSIDYTKVKTMEIRYFPNQAPRVYPQLATAFNEKIKDFFTRNTKLSFVEVGANLELEGEIVRYDLTPVAIKETADGSDIRASGTKLTMTVKFRFRNNVNPTEDKEELVSAEKEFDSNVMFDEVQDQLIEELNQEIVDKIFNATLSNW